MLQAFSYAYRNICDNLKQKSAFMRTSALTCGVSFNFGVVVLFGGRHKSHDRLCLTHKGRDRLSVKYVRFGRC